MLRLLSTFLIALSLQTQTMAQADPVSLSGDSDSCMSYDDVDALAFRFFNPAVRIEKNFLIISVDDSFYKCAQSADGSFTYTPERQTQTSSLAAQYWTLFNISSWDASFVGGPGIRTASVEIPLKSILSPDEWTSYKSGEQIDKTIYLFLNSSLISGISAGHFDIAIGLRSGAAFIRSFQ